MQSFGQQGLATYTPSRTTGITYSSISGTGTAPAFFRNGLSTDDNLSTFLPIGFNFLYDGVQMNSFQMSTNGFINLLANTGAAGGSGAYSWDNTLFTSSSLRVISAFYDDHQTAGNLGTLADLQASMKYQTTGLVGSRICTIEWINMQDFSAGSTSSFNWQVKLYEGSNNIEFVYSTMTFGGAGTRSFSVGLNSSTLTGVSPFATTMVFTQQTANSATFGGTAQNAWGIPDLPAANSSILFTYGGAAPAPLAGTYTIPGSYANFTAAINALNYNGVFAATTFNVAAGSTFVENAPILQVGAQTSAITFQKSGGGANPVIQASGGAGALDAGIRMWGGSNIGFNGIDITATAATLEYGYVVQQYTNLIGAQNVIIENTAVTMNRANTGSIGIIQSSIVTPALIAAGTNSNNIYRNLTIKNAYAGIQVAGAGAVTYNAVAQTVAPDNNNQITTSACGTYNIIGDPSTANDIGNGTVATYGIFMSNQANYVVENCKIQNVTSTGTTVRTDGIVANCNAWLALVSGGSSRINNNQIFTLRMTAATTGVVSGIRLNTNINAGTNVRVFNNFIGDLSSTSTSTTGRRILGISLQDAGTGNPSTMEIWNNSIRLEPAGLATPNACIELLTSTTGPIVTLKNNILANFTAAQAGSAKHYCIVSSSGTAWGAVGSTSDFNDMYVANATNGFVGLTSATDRITRPDWTAAIATPAGTDANTLSLDPLYTGPLNLHIPAAGPLQSAGTTVPAYVTNDIDCTNRPSNPTIGADETLVLTCTQPNGSISLSGQGCSNFNVNVTVTTVGDSPGSVVDILIDGSPVQTGVPVGGPYGPFTLTNGAHTVTLVHLGDGLCNRGLSGASYTAPACNDNNPTTSDACVANACVFTPIPCDDANPCTTGDVLTLQSTTQNFDGVTVPALPAGWVSAVPVGVGAQWTTTTAFFDVLQSVFTNQVATVSEQNLTTPVIAVTTASAQLTFKHRWAFEASTLPNTWDGGVLEIKIGAGAFTDIITAGGSFVTNGYNSTVSASFSNPLGGRAAWGNNSSGVFVTTTVNLPASAAGQSVQFRWRLGSDTSGAGTGWWIDTFSVTDVICMGTPLVNTDGDGQCDLIDTDDDNDGVADGSDNAPLNTNSCEDADGDGCDDCSGTHDGFGPLANNDPADDGLDTDSDGLCDSGDGDDDNDGVADGSDNAPLNTNSCEDADGDGCDDCSGTHDGFGP